MPKEIKDIKQFLEVARRTDAKAVTIKSPKKSAKNASKFKIRTSRNLYTFVISSDKADKLRQSLPPALNVVDV